VGWWHNIGWLTVELCYQDWRCIPAQRTSLFKSARPAQLLTTDNDRADK